MKKLISLLLLCAAPAAQIIPPGPMIPGVLPNEDPGFCTTANPGEPFGTNPCPVNFHLEGSCLDLCFEGFQAAQRNTNLGFCFLYDDGHKAYLNERDQAWTQYNGCMDEAETPIEEAQCLLNLIDSLNAINQSWQTLSGDIHENYFDETASNFANYWSCAAGCCTPDEPVPYTSVQVGQPGFAIPAPAPDNNPYCSNSSANPVGADPCEIDPVCKATCQTQYRISVNATRSTFCGQYNTAYQEYLEDHADIVAVFNSCMEDAETENEKAYCRGQVLIRLAQLDSAWSGWVTTKAESYGNVLLDHLSTYDTCLFACCEEAQSVRFEELMMVGAESSGGMAPSTPAQLPNNNPFCITFTQPPSGPLACLVPGVLFEYCLENYLNNVNALAVAYCRNYDDHYLNYEQERLEAVGIYLQCVVDATGDPTAIDDCFNNYVEELERLNKEFKIFTQSQVRSFNRLIGVYANQYFSCLC